MFNNNKSRIIEHLLINAGNTTNISDSVKVKKSFENNQKINRSMTVDSLSKIFNNVATEVIQKNSTSAAAAIGASNTLFISGVKCETVRIAGNRQVSASQLELQVKSQQSNTSKVTNEITNTINKTIEKIGATDLAALQAENTKQLNDYMSAMPGYDPNKAQKLASECPSGGGLISGGNTCNVNTSYELDGSVKQALDLDESFKITDNDDVNNEIKNKIEQSNFASCQANASAQNAIIIQDIMCTVNNAAVGAEKSSKRGGEFEFEDNEQTAVAKLFMTCIFDQNSVSEIINKMMNNIAKKYNQIYDAVEKKAQTKGPEYYKKASELVDLLSAAGTEQIQAAAGNLPSRDAKSGKEVKTETKSESSGTDSATGPLPAMKPSDSIDKVVKDLATEKTKQKQVQLETEAAEVSAQQEKDKSDREDRIKKEQIEREIQAKKDEQTRLDRLAKEKKDVEVAEQIIKEEQIQADETRKTYTWFAIGGAVLLIIIILSIVLLSGKKKAPSQLEDSDDE
jgi:hypothetical protein